MVVAILRKEILGSGRNGRYFAVRAGYLVLLACVVIPALHVLVDEMQRVRNFRTFSRGQEFTLAFGSLQILLSILVAPSLSIGAITSEKASGVLDLLHVSGIRPHQIVLGKLAARMAWIALMVASGMPLLFAGTLMGGAGLELVLLIVAHALVAGVVGSAVGLSVSAALRQAVPAVFAAYSLLFIVYVGPMLANAFLGFSDAHLWIPFAAITGLSNGFLQHEAWLSLVPQLLAGVLLLLPAIALTRPGQEEGRRDFSNAGVALLEANVLHRARPFADRVRRSATVTGNPVAWREARASRHSFPLRLVRLVYLSVGAAIAFHLLAFSVMGGFQDLSRYGVLFLSLGSAGMAMVVSCTVVSSERETRSLPLLHLSRMTPAEVLIGKLRVLMASGCTVGVFFSTLFNRSTAAVGVCLAVVFSWIAVVPIAMAFLVKSNSWLWELESMVNPVITMARLTDGFGTTVAWSGSRRVYDPNLPLGGLLFLVAVSAILAGISMGRLERGDEG